MWWSVGTCSSCLCLLTVLPRCTTSSDCSRKLRWLTFILVIQYASFSIQQWLILLCSLHKWSKIYHISAGMYTCVCMISVFLWKDAGNMINGWHTVLKLKLGGGGWLNLSASTVSFTTFWKFSGLRSVNILVSLGFNFTSHYNSHLSPNIWNKLGLHCPNSEVIFKLL